MISGFYQFLGCKQLSDLIQEEHQTTQEIYKHQTAQEVWSLILERLPLFLREHTHMAPQVSLTWLNDERNFIVQTFGEITVTRSINFGGVKSSRSTEVSAVAKQGGMGEIRLWLAGNMEVDMYEVANSLCHLLFEKTRVIDTLLFTTILSVDLCALQRQGFNGDNEVHSIVNSAYWIFVVSSILKQQKAEREAAEEAHEKEKAERKAAEEALAKEKAEMKAVKETLAKEKTERMAVRKQVLGY